MKIKFKRPDLDFLIPFGVVASLVCGAILLFTFILTSGDLYKTNNVTFVKEEIVEEGNTYQLAIFEKEDGQVYKFYAKEEVMNGLESGASYDVTYKMGQWGYPQDYGLTEALPVGATKLEK